MVRIPLSVQKLLDKHWLVYVNENGEKKHVDMAGCEGSCERNTGCVFDSGLQAVGCLYQKKGQLCYELFNGVHTVICTPVKYSLVQTLGYLHSGKNAEETYRGILASFEETLNQGVWKTVAREEIKE